VSAVAGVIHIRLSAVILAVRETVPLVLSIEDHGGEALPFAPLAADADRTLEVVLRRVVREQTGMELGYVEQLYTFGDVARDPSGRTISIAYLALVREDQVTTSSTVSWRDCYQLFPWEDWRGGRPASIDARIVPVLVSWAGDDESRKERADITFGMGGSPWDETRVLERYELLYEVGLVAESHRDRDRPSSELLGQPMSLDHRRMVATALGRIRGKLSYRPVVFELLPEQFTLSRLQQVVEALDGRNLHKPNFRRLVEQGGLVESTGALETKTGGRPAALFRFRRDVLRERPAPGVGLPGAH
jgi:hypothetical protein